MAAVSPKTKQWSPTISLPFFLLCWSCYPVSYTLAKCLPCNCIPNLKTSFPSQHLPFSISFSLSVHAHACVQMSTLDVFLNCLPSYLLRQCLSLGMEHQLGWSPSLRPTCDPWRPRCWHYRHTLPHQAFSYGSGNWTQVLRFASSTLQPEPFP